MKSQISTNISQLKKKYSSQLARRQNSWNPFNSSILEVKGNITKYYNSQNLREYIYKKTVTEYIREKNIKNMQDVAGRAASADKGSFCPDVWRPRYNRPGEKFKSHNFNQPGKNCMIIYLQLYSTRS